MSTILALYAKRAAPPLPARRIAGRIKAWWKAYGDRRTHRETLRVLTALDERTLKDIGLHRAELEWAALNQAAGRPRVYQADWR